MRRRDFTVSARKTKLVQQTISLQEAWVEPQVHGCWHLFLSAGDSSNFTEVLFQPIQPLQELKSVLLCFFFMMGCDFM